MATQRLIAAVLGGDAASVVAARFRSWRAGPAPDPRAVDRFCSELRANGAALPVLYFCDWVDRWLMGNSVPGPGAVAGGRFETTCLSPVEAAAWADRCGRQSPEQEWLAARLREAAAAWELVAESRAVVVIREVLDGSTTDDEVRAALRGVPGWLAGEFR
jgi:hypothetical protein